MDVHEYASPPSFEQFGTDSRGAYLSAIHWVDDALSRIRELLASNGVLDHTVLILAADHGETFGENGVHGHARNVLTAVVSVPLVIRLPFAVDPPVRVSTQVRNLDIAPMLLELAGVDVPESFEGRSLLPLISGSAPEDDRPSFAALGTPLFMDASVQTAFTDGTWTYARNAEASEPEPGRAAGRRRRPVAPGAEFLFDRSVDPGENANVLQYEPDEARRMRAQLEAHMAAGPKGVTETDVRIDPAIEERLRAMGYLN